MTSAFRFGAPAAARPPRLPETVKELARVKRELAILPKPTLPGMDQQMPTQAKGDRKRTPGNA
jgi:phospholipase C